MKIDIAESIREVLDDWHPVSIEGIGTIRLQQIPASFGNQRKSLLPPKVQISFDRKLEENNYLEKWLRLKYDINKDKVKAVIKAFNERVLNTLVNYGKVNLSGVALFYKDENDRITCKGNENFLNLYYKGLPEIDIEIVKEKVDNKNDLSIVPNLVTTDSSVEVVDIKESAPIIQDKDIPTVGLNTTIADELKLDVEKDIVIGSVNTAENIILSINEKFANEDVNSSDMLSEEDSFNGNEMNGSNNELRKSTNWPLYLVTALIAILLGLMCFKGCQYWNDNHKNAMVTDHLDTDSQSVSEVLDTLETSSSIPAINQEFCIIITGVFSKPKNVIRMQDELTRQGYEVYKEVYGNLTRVGIGFKCQDADLEAYIQDVRRRLSAKAWYLDPELYVEYE